MSQREKKGYARKVEAGTHPHIYDKNSQRFKEGAWRNQSPDEAQRNRNALMKSRPQD